MSKMRLFSRSLVPALFASVILPAQAEVLFKIGTGAEYRQYRHGNMTYRGGMFDVNMRDGNFVYGNCSGYRYRPPAKDFGIILSPCELGTTGYLTFGNYGRDSKYNGRRYIAASQVIPASVIEPGLPKLCALTAAPASQLKRPAYPFKDDSFGMYYNLHFPNVQEYRMATYFYSLKYGRKQRGEFETEIVPGVYHYEFPRVDRPELKARLRAQIFEMPEGYKKVRNRWQGIRFTNTKRWTKDGFLEFQQRRPNKVTWEGFEPSNTYASVDSLHIAIKYMRNEKNPRSKTIHFDPETGAKPASLFPAYTLDNGDWYYWDDDDIVVEDEENDARRSAPKINLPNPYVGEFTFPPLIAGGSRGILELELTRRLLTGGVTYDNSNRKFQIPVAVLDRYSDYANDIFPNNRLRRVGLLDDFDKDGYNNMTEWILDSDASTELSVPEELVPEYVPRDVDYDWYWGWYWGYYWDEDDTFDIDGGYFGFTLDKKQGTRPKVKYTLQVSKNDGKTWKVMEPDEEDEFGNRIPKDENWLVVNDSTKIAIISTHRSDEDIAVQPPRTGGHIYRVKITTKKKKKKK